MGVSVAVPVKEMSDGNGIPALGLGTWQLDGDACRLAVRQALDMGYSHIDTAEMYGNEEEIGETLENHGADRGELFLTSKVWFENLGYEKTMAAAEKSLDKLRTDYLDLFLIHWPREGMDLEGAFRAFRELIDNGRLRSAGVSNFNTRRMRQALDAAKKTGITVTVNQVEFHPGLYQKELLDYCRENDVVVTAYSPIAKGRLTGNDTMGQIAGSHGRSEEQVALRWLLQHGLVAIPKSSSKDHLKENLDIFDFELTESEMSAIDSLGDSNRLIDPDFGEFD